MTTKEALRPYFPIIEGVVALFSPFLEVAIHNIQTGKIAAIYNNLSNRKVGDPSPIEQLKIPLDKFPDVFEPYYETNWNGHKIKCTTVTIRDKDKKAIALICFNLDTFTFQEIQLNLKTFLEVKNTSNNPVELFNENWQAKIDQSIEEYLSQNKLMLGSLTREQKQILIEDLSKKGVFFYKNAAIYIAGRLNLSRATIYNYLKVLRADN